LGLAFKPNNDDIREAPALYLIKELIAEGATVAVYDLEAMDNVKQTFGDTIIFADNQYATLKDADALIIATEWSEFRTPDFSRIEKDLNAKVIFDGRNVFDVQQMRELGYHYESIGRPF